jgi:predicted transcriptional regulator
VIISIIGGGYHVDTGQYFSEIDEEISLIFVDIGLKKNTARVLTILLKEINLTSREIERWADLRQPEVSLAITDLIKRRWVQKTDKNSENKGRPVHIYHLAIPVDNILDDLQGMLTVSYQKSMSNLERVRELIMESRNKV